MINIGIFGGPFDPPTIAHLEISENLIKKNIVDYIMFMPAYKTSHDKILTDFIHRYNMLYEQNVHSIYSDYLTISNFELRVPNNVGRSFETISLFNEEVKKNRHDNNDYNFYFIMGMDNALNIKKFYRGKDLTSLMPFIILNRNGSKKESNVWFNKHPHVYVDDILISDISSTKIRNELKDIANKGLSKDFFKMCNLDVLSYIMKHKLYM